MERWLLVYIILSIPVLLFYAAGLSGWFFDYPLALFIAIFLLLAIPPALILFKYPQAPQWNIAMLWIAAILMTSRLTYGVLFQRVREGLPRLSGEELLAAMPTLLGIELFTLGWATIWTIYFKRSL